MVMPKMRAAAATTARPPIPPWWQTGFENMNSAYSFNGTSSFIECQRNLPDMSRYSISFWVISANTQEAAVILRGDPIGFKDLFVSTFSNAVRFRCDKIGGVGVSHDVGIPTDSIWVHFVSVAKPDSLSMYVNGVLKQTVTCGNFAFAGFHYPFQIGRAADGVNNGYYYTGAIDVVRIYKRALSQDDVTKLQNEINPTRIKNSKAFVLECYPSPNHDVLTIRAGVALGQLTRSNSLGVVVYQQQSTAGTMRINISAWPAALYTVMVLKDGLSARRLIVKQ